MVRSDGLDVEAQAELGSGSCTWFRRSVLAAFGQVGTASGQERAEDTLISVPVEAVVCGR
jgi:hypothetical protein